MSKYLIINCDDFGQSKAANAAIMHLLEQNKVSSATIMPPAPAFEEAASWVRKTGNPNIGLHLTFTSEFAGLRWSSLTGHPSLHDDSGYMHMTVEQFELRANPRAVKAEMSAQFAKVKQAGLAITHVDNHMGSLYGLATGRSYLPSVFWECSKRGLPFRIFRNVYEKDEFLASIPDVKQILAKVVTLADALGVPMPDYLISHPYYIEEGETYDSFKRSLVAKLYELPDGVSETYIHPGIDDPQMQAIIPSWEKRTWEFRLMQDDDFSYAMRDAGVTLTDYRYVREKLRRPRLQSLMALVKLFAKR